MNLTRGKITDHKLNYSFDIIGRIVLLLIVDYIIVIFIVHRKKFFKNILQLEIFFVCKYKRRRHMLDNAKHTIYAILLFLSLIS